MKTKKILAIAVMVVLFCSCNSRQNPPIKSDNIFQKVEFECYSSYIDDNMTIEYVSVYFVSTICNSIGYSEIFTCTETTLDSVKCDEYQKCKHVVETINKANELKCE